MSLTEKIRAAEARRDEAANQSNEAEKAKAEAQLSQLRELESEGYVEQSAANTGASQARTEGRTSGEKAEREKQAKALGVNESELDDELKRIREMKDKDKTEAQRLQGELDSYKQSADSEKQAREKAEARANKLAINSALAEELSKHNVLSDRREGALSLADTSEVQVKDDGSVEGTEKAVKSLKENHPYFFGEEQTQTPPTPPAGGGGSGGSGEDSPARQWAKRQMRRAG